MRGLKPARVCMAYGPVLRALQGFCTKAGSRGDERSIVLETRRQMLLMPLPQCEVG